MRTAEESIFLAPQLGYVHDAGTSAGRQEIPWR
jgi:hypothetical protein